MGGLADKNIVLGVTGGIAVYKAVELARLLVKKGAGVKVIMTEAATRFVNPLTFRVVTDNPVITSMWSDPVEPIPHISLSDEADIIIIAPATANIIAKCAHGIADDMLSTTVLAAKGTVVVAPAMNTRMLEHPATAGNIKALKDRGVFIIEPGVGELACGEEGAGRMAEPALIVEALEGLDTPAADLDGVRIMITAGPTREYIDPVRYISNPSTGLMGYTVADIASKRGADVLLISGPTALAPPPGVKTVQVISASEMKDAVMDGLGSVDVLIMAAAVADYKPRDVAENKIKKRDGVPVIALEPTEDILRKVSAEKGKVLIVGFAAETENVIENALIKLREKKMDFIVANKVDEEGTGFGTSTDLAAIFSPGAKDGKLSLMTKVELAEMILDRVADSTE